MAALRDNQDVELTVMRNSIDALDDAIAQLLDERSRLSVRIQLQRIQSGRARVDISRERDVLDRYALNLGPHNGRHFGEAVLTYCRG